MKLASVHITNFRSIEDSGEFQIGSLTCLVGKNEAGKTAVLSALNGLNPFDEFKYEKTRDYPRRYLNKYDERNPDGESKVIETKWVLDDADIQAVESIFGADVLTKKEVVVTRSFESEVTSWTLKVDEAKVLRNLEVSSRLSSEEKKSTSPFQSTKELHAFLTGLPQRSPAQDALLATISEFRKLSPILAAIDILYKRFPKFFYTSHFDRMSGEISIEKIIKDRNNNVLSTGDKIFLDFLE